MQVNNPSATASALSSLTGSASSNASASSTSNGTSSFQQLLSELNTYAKETPAQRMEDSILSQLGVTRQQLAQMTPAAREKIMQEVREMMKKEMAAQTQQQQIQQALQSAAVASGSTAQATTVPSAHGHASHSHMHTQTVASDKGSAINVAI
jgi:hypothetical protein